VPPKWAHRPGLLAVALVAVLAAARAGADGPAAAFLAELPAGERQALARLVDAPDVGTRVEAEPFLARWDLFEYLLDHPEFASHVARSVRAARYRIWSTPAGLQLDDGWGVTGQFRVVHTSNGTRIYHARGEYRPALLPTIRGEAMTMIEYALSPGPEGRTLVRPAVSGFVRLDSRLAALFLKVASRAAQRKADREARQLMKVFARVSRALDEQPAKVWAELSQRPDVPPGELEEFGWLLNGR
jgi:hypothetical protein